MKKRWTVAIVEPCHLVCAGIAQAFARTAFRRHIQCASMEELWQALQPDDVIDLFLIDVQHSLIPLCADIEKLKRLFPTSFIVLFSDTVDLDEVTRALRANVHGFIQKSTRPEAMIKLLELIALGEQVFPTRALLNKSGSPPLKMPDQSHNNGHSIDVQEKICNLSSREMEVLGWLGEGKSNKEIARLLDISDATVKVHVKAILRKLRVKNRTKAALWVTESGFAGLPLRRH